MSAPSTTVAASAEPRKALFISHAAPEDNLFTIWLGAKLAAMGYEVWADVLRLNGGDDWQRKLEHALRLRARKVLLVANPRAVDKQGVRNEIQIACDVARKIDDPAFIIPLRMEPFEAPFLIAHAQYIDFQRGWAHGLTELLGTLEETYRVPRDARDGDAIWRDIQLIHGKTLSATPERLISNWLSITTLPEKIRFYDFKGQVSERQTQSRMNDAPWPLVPFRRGFLSFARLHDLQEHFGQSLPLKLAAERRVEGFLEEGWSKLDIERGDARNRFSDLVHQAFEKLFRERGLLGYALSGWQTAWWPPIDVAPTTKVGFRWGDVAGLRQIQGVSLKRRMNWHFGVSIAARTAPIRHVRVLSRLVFTEDGRKPFEDPAKMHRLRRSFAKTWRNARWRDMLLAFLHWLAEGKSALLVPLSSEESLVLTLPPISWMAPVSLPVQEEAPEPDEDDPSDDDEVDTLDRDDGAGVAGDSPDDL
ncbi:toll/interleukin-1 receptor domain-containing protein [Mesorhizobium sp. LjRoot246]|uniref:toll/interleukin-1 receptor domain-containing protein n=1 Tax=Mesorhizobium sp. LjRoot246 TaxID=3342294 RepID=UPI003ECD461C